MADWTRIQGVADATGGVTSKNVSFAGAITGGNIIVGGVLLSTGLTLTSVTDDKSNAYTVFQSNDDATLYSTGYRSNAIITNAPTTLTFTASASAGTFWTIQDEFSPPTGATGALTVDGSSSAANVAGGTDVAFPNFTTAKTDDLEYATAMVSGTATVGTGFNSGTGSGTARFSEWGIKTTAGTVTMLVTATGNFWGPAFGINVAAGVGGFAAAKQNLKIDKFKTPGRSQGPNAGLFQMKAFPVQPAQATVPQLIVEILQARQRASYW